MWHRFAIWFALSLSYFRHFSTHQISKSPYKMENVMVIDRSISRKLFSLINLSILHFPRIAEIASVLHLQFAFTSMALLTHLTACKKRRNLRSMQEADAFMTSTKFWGSEFLFLCISFSSSTQHYMRIPLPPFTSSTLRGHT